jgi:hypothetical protein
MVVFARSKNSSSSNGASFAGGASGSCTCGRVVMAALPDDTRVITSRPVINKFKFRPI